MFEKQLIMTALWHYFVKFIKSLLGVGKWDEGLLQQAELEHPHLPAGDNTAHVVEGGVGHLGRVPVEVPDQFWVLGEMFVRAKNFLAMFVSTPSFRNHVTLLCLPFSSSPHSAPCGPSPCHSQQLWERRCRLALLLKTSSLMDRWTSYKTEK